MSLGSSIPLLRALVAAAAVGHVAIAAAQQGNRDYYAVDRSDREQRELLKNVEIHHLPLATRSIKTRQYASALADLEFVLNFYPNHPQALVMLGELCAMWRSPKCLPEESFARAVAVNPKVPGTYTARGIFLLREQRVKDSIASFRQALELDPDSLNAHYNIGLAYIEAKEYELANQHAQKAYALGAPVPGLREKLKRAGHWRPIETPKLEASAPPSPAAAKAQTEPAPADNPGLDKPTD
jgi:tetratricopeptide (TPR) repeat protein